MNHAIARPRRRSRAVVAVVGITLLALALRLAAVDESLFGDELFTYEIATRSDLHAVLAGVRSGLEITPPLYFVVAWVFQQLGDPLLWLRVPSLLAGVATVPLVYVLGARTVGRRAAVAGAGLFALSPLAIFYATEARAYALMTLLVVLSTLTLLRAIEANTWRWWAALALVQAAAMYSHYTSAFVLVAQAAWALFVRRDLIRSMVAAHVGSALVFLPWLPSMLDDRHAPGQAAMEHLVPFTATSALRNLGRLADGGPYAPLTDLPGTPALVLLATAAAIGLGGLAHRTIRPAGRSVPERAGLVLLLALAAPVGAGVYSVLGGDLFLTRNLISSLPALALAFAALLTALPRALAAAALVLAVTGMGLGAAATFEKDTQRPAYGEVAAYLESHTRPGDVVIELKVGNGPPGNVLTVELESNLPVYRGVEESDALAAAQASGGRIFFVHPQLRATGSFGLHQVERTFREVESRTWEGVADVTVDVYEPRQ